MDVYQFQIIVLLMMLKDIVLNVIKDTISIKTDNVYSQILTIKDLLT